MPDPRLSRVARSLLAAAVVLSACVPSPSAAPPGPPPPGAAEVGPGSSDARVRVTFLHLNDIYEITPTGGGRWGGPARVATLKKRLEEENPHTFAILAGDLFSPSALGTARYRGERLAGRQMVAVLNAMGLDYATFGNHEFDLSEQAFRDRMTETRFAWFSANVTDASGQPFADVPLHRILEVEGPRGTARIGLIGVTYEGFQPPYIGIREAIGAVREQVDLIRDSVDALVAVTHLQLRQDVALAEAVPELDLILGGHEHENFLLRRGPGLTPIYKADANVRTVWIHRLAIDPVTDDVEVASELVEITDTIPDDPATVAVVNEWLEVGFAGFRTGGFDPGEVVATVPEHLDGLEATVRNRPTRLTELIVAGMAAEIEDSDGAILNSGSIRIDDVIPPGPVTQYDVIRVLPFGGPVVEVEMTGALLRRVLDQGRANLGNGGYLQLAGIVETPDGWQVGGRALEPGGTYRLAISDFLLTGQEEGLRFLNQDAEGLQVVREGRDVRMTLIDELRRQYGSR